MIIIILGTNAHCDESLKKMKWLALKQLLSVMYQLNLQQTGKMGKSLDYLTNNQGIIQKTPYEFSDLNQIHFDFGITVFICENNLPFITLCSGNVYLYVKK